MPDYFTPKTLHDIGERVYKLAEGKPFCFAFAPGQDKPRVYWSSETRNDKEPHDAAVNCIQQLHSGRGRWREGIVLYGYKYAITEMASGMHAFVGRYEGKDPFAQKQFELIPCGKRTDGLPEFATALSSPNVNLLTENKSSDYKKGDESEHVVHRLYMMLAFALINSRKAGELKTSDIADGHNIGAVLVAKDGRLLGWGLNTHEKNYTFHAELNAIQGFKGKLPEGCHIYTTLKPCLMCAGMIADAADNPETLRVFFAQDDASAKGTALDDLKGVQRLLGERQAFVGWKIKQLQEAGIQFSQAKALRLTQGDVKSDAAATLQTSYIENMKQFSGSYTGYLNQDPTAQGVFSSASGRLLDKYKKYKIQSGNPAVKRVLDHIGPFMMNMGIMKGGPAPAHGPEANIVKADAMSENLGKLEETEITQPSKRNKHPSEDK